MSSTVQPCAKSSGTPADAVTQKGYYYASRGARTFGTGLCDHGKRASSTSRPDPTIYLRQTTATKLKRLTKRVSYGNYRNNKMGGITFIDSHPTRRTLILCRGREEEGNTTQSKTLMPTSERVGDSRPTHAPNYTTNTGRARTGTQANSN